MSVTGIKMFEIDDAQIALEIGVPSRFFPLEKRAVREVFGSVWQLPAHVAGGHFPTDEELMQWNRAAARAHSLFNSTDTTYAAATRAIFQRYLLFSQAHMSAATGVATQGGPGAGSCVLV